MVRISDNGCRTPGFLRPHIVLNVSVLIFGVFHTRCHLADGGCHATNVLRHHDDLLGI